MLISCITSRGKCAYCRKLMYSHCTTGSWILGNTIDGTQAEFVRVPHADTSLHPMPDGADEEALVMLSDVLPTGFECGVLNGEVRPGGIVAIAGAGPIGLAALLTAQFYSPAEIIMIDLDDNRLEVARRFGATAAVNSANGKAAETIMKMTGNRGVDTAIEAVGIAATFELCEKIMAPGGVIANVGVLWHESGFAPGEPLGSKHHHQDAVGGYRQHAYAAQCSPVPEDGPEATHHTPLQSRPYPRCL